MRKAFLAAAICLSATVTASAQLQPLNVKAGQWEVTSVSAINATLPPELQAMMSRLPPAQQEALRSRFGGTPQTIKYKSCITQEDLAKGPYKDPNQKCTWTVLTSTSSDMQLRATACRGPDQREMLGEIDVNIHVVNSENTTGSSQVNITGNNGTKMATNATFTGKWLGATCDQN
jgi:hypothetical protein